MARAATRALLGAAGRVHLICAQMGGGNGQKSAMARQRNQAKLDAEGQGGGGAEGKEQRGGDTGAKIAKSQAEKAEKEQKKLGAPAPPPSRPPPRAAQLRAWQQGHNATG